MALRAEKLEWDKITEEWATTETLFTKLQTFSLANLPPAERDEAEALIKKILAIQAAVTARAKPWMKDVKSMLESFDRNSLKPASGA